MSRYWYYYSGNGNDSVASNYNLGPNAPSDLCFGGRVTCAIYSEPSSASNNSKPKALSANLLAYISTAKDLSTPYPSGSFAFVYVRSAT